MFEHLFPLVTSKYLFPFVLFMMLLSLLFRFLKSFSTSDREKYDYWKEALAYPTIIIFILGIFYYWHSPFTVFWQRIASIFVFGLVVLSVIASKYLHKTQMQLYISYLLEMASILSVLWLIIIS